MALSITDLPFTWVVKVHVSVADLLDNPKAVFGGKPTVSVHFEQFYQAGLPEHRRDPKVDRMLCFFGDRIDYNINPILRELYTAGVYCDRVFEDSLDFRLLGGKPDYAFSKRIMTKMDTAYLLFKSWAVKRQTV